MCSNRETNQDNSENNNESMPEDLHVPHSESANYSQAQDGGSDTISVDTDNS